MIFGNRAAHEIKFAQPFENIVVFRLDADNHLRGGNRFDDLPMIGVIQGDFGEFLHGGGVFSGAFIQFAQREMHRNRPVGDLRISFENGLIADGFLMNVVDLKRRCVSSHHRPFKK